MCDAPASGNPVDADRTDDGAASASQPNAFRIVIYPFHGPNEGVDVTDVLIDAVAQVLWKLQGGNEPVNQLEARVLLERAMGPQGDERQQERPP